MPSFVIIVVLKLMGAIIMRKFHKRIVLIHIVGLNLMCYVYERNVTVSVENMRQQAEDLALKGKISEATNLIDKALGLRPNNKTLQTDKIAIKTKIVDISYNNANEFLKKIIFQMQNLQ